MKLLDRYVAQQYLFNVLALFVILFSFVVTIDVAINIDRFIRNADRVAGGDAGGTLRRLTLAALLIADLWWPKLLQLYNFMLGLVLIGAMGFTVTQLVRHRELVAMLAGGQSLTRLFKPILIVAAAMTTLQVINQEFVLSHPSITPLLARSHGDVGKRNWGAQELTMTPDGRRRIWQAHRFDPDENQGTLTNVSIWIRDDTGRPTLRVHAPTATWQDGAWSLTDPTVESLQAPAAGAPRRQTPANADDYRRIQTDLDPTTMIIKRRAEVSQYLSFAQLSQMLANNDLDQRLRDKLERARIGRLASLLCMFLSLLIVTPFFLTREPKAPVAQALKAAPVGIAALLGATLGTQAAIPGIPPAASVFIPVVILTAFAILTLSSIRS